MAGRQGLGDVGDRFAGVARRRRRKSLRVRQERIGRCGGIGLGRRLQHEYLASRLRPVHGDHPSASHSGRQQRRHRRDARQRRDLRPCIDWPARRQHAKRLPVGSRRRSGHLESDALRPADRRLGQRLFSANGQARESGRLLAAGWVCRPERQRPSREFRPHRVQHTLLA